MQEFFLWVVVKMVTFVRSAEKNLRNHLQNGLFAATLECSKKIDPIVVEVPTKSEIIAPQTMIISCEACGEVRYFDAASDDESANLFSSFRCKKGCDRSYYSYITIGQIAMSEPRHLAADETAPLQKKAAVHG